MIYVAIALMFLTFGAFGVSMMLEEGRGFIRLVGAGGLLLTFMAFAMSAVVTVQPGHVGIPILFGAVQDTTLSEGFHFVNPFMVVDEMTIQTQSITMTGETAIRTPSSDQLEMVIDITILYHVNAGQAAGLRRLIPNYTDDVVTASVRTAVRNAVRSYDAVAAVSTGRERLGHDMVRLVRQRVGNVLEQRELESYTIQIDDVLLRNISLPRAIQASIESVQTQRQAGNERTQAIRTAEQEAERATAEAEGQRRVAIIEANRDAEARLIRATADAQANDILNQSITPDILRLRAIDATRAITSSNNTRTVILGGGSQQMPLIMNMGQN